ncbi:MAG: phage tail tape measure protein, partial [Salinibacterium sp.]|nr:phage tail tape measure protein [Salinibacterium sp.]
MSRRYRIEVVVDPSNARAGTQEVRRGLRDATDDARRMGRAITLAFAALGAAGGLAGSTRLLASFGQAMSTVEAVTNSTRGEFRELNAEGQRLGANTRFSATQAAEGMIYLARAGFDANEVLGATEGTLQLAQAGALGLGEAADIASNILQGFRLQVDQTSRVVDVLALAANSSNTDVTQLGDAMAYVAPVAAGLGLQIEETAAAIGALSNAGLQGSMAGTGLRRVLSELESPSQKSRDILASMGVTADEVRISQVGLTAALQRLAEAGIDTGQALEIFGDRGGPAFEVLASSIPDVVR